MLRMTPSEVQCCATIACVGLARIDGRTRRTRSMEKCSRLEKAPNFGQGKEETASDGIAISKRFNLLIIEIFLK